MRALQTLAGYYTLAFMWGITMLYLPKIPTLNLPCRKTSILQEPLHKTKHYSVQTEKKLTLSNSDILPFSAGT